MNRAPFIEVARVVKTHGVKGEVSVTLLADLPFDVLEGLSVWVVPPVPGLGETRITGVRQGPKGVLLTCDGVSDLNAASALRGKILSARSTDVPEVTVESEPDPVGWLVTDVDRGMLGEIVDVIVTGANDVWVVRGDRYGEVLLPVIDDVVLDIDLDRGLVSVRLLPGLLPEGA
jgi:16S rRNA processing protein RimM